MIRKVNILVRNCENVLYYKKEEIIWNLEQIAEIMTKVEKGQAYEYGMKLLLQFLKRHDLLMAV